MTDRVLSLDEIDGWTGRPLVLFVGISTVGSLAHAVFDGWAAALGQSWALRGVDLPPDTPPETYRRLLAVMRHNPRVRGAVITAHKLRLYRACAPNLNSRDRFVDLTREINTLVTTDGVAGYANDARSLTAILGSVAGHRIVCLGAGGAATTLLLALHLDIDTVADRIGARPELVHLSGPADDLVAGAALVVNATGLGKDRPGSPITDYAPLGPGTVAWDLNYRGDLTFLRQAATRRASIMDGWDYFVAGWAGALTTIAGEPFSPHVRSALAAAAAPYRPTGVQT